MKIVGHAGLRSLVEELLYDDQSPENIAGRVRKYAKRLPTISKDGVYRFIKSVYGRRIESHRNARKQKRRKYHPRVAALSERTFIDKRPRHINARSRSGDVEADFIVSGKTGRGILLVVVDRKLRVTFIERILDVSVANVHRAFLRIQQRFPELRTITTDNDILFQIIRHSPLFWGCASISVGRITPGRKERLRIQTASYAKTYRKAQTFLAIQRHLYKSSRTS